MQARLAEKRDQVVALEGSLAAVSDEKLAQATRLHEQLSAAHTAADELRAELDAATRQAAAAAVQAEQAVGAAERRAAAAAADAEDARRELQQQVSTLQFEVSQARAAARGATDAATELQVCAPSPCHPRLPCTAAMLHGCCCTCVTAASAAQSRQAAAAEGTAGTCTQGPLTPCAPPPLPVTRRASWNNAWWTWMRPSSSWRPWSTMRSSAGTSLRGERWGGGGGEGVHRALAAPARPTAACSLCCL